MIKSETAADKDNTSDLYNFLSYFVSSDGHLVSKSL